MAFDPQKLLSAPPIVTRYTLTENKAILYALGVGARELQFVYEDGLKALPTMGVVIGYPGFIWRDPAYGVNWQKILHAEQSTQIFRPLPVKGELRGETRFVALYDKGADKGTLCIVERKIFDEADGALIATANQTTFLRGDGGHGGSEGSPPAPHAIPDRPADKSVTLESSWDQAILYRLSGDLNPLHIDPAVAKAAGFEKPILHGLCSYGIVGRALVQALVDNNPERLTRMDCRFSSPVYPGETLATEIWIEGEGKAAFRTKVVERDLVVLNNGYAEFI
jgi:acyl dehydratase